MVALPEPLPLEVKVIQEAEAVAVQLQYDAVVRLKEPLPPPADILAVAGLIVYAQGGGELTCMMMRLCCGPFGDAGADTATMP